MKFSLKSSENILILIRKIGYFLLKYDPEKNEYICLKPLGPSGFPRFHLYIKKEKDKLEFSLHLDQKRPIYKGAPAHSGEYQGEIVEKEAERIKNILTK